MSADKKFTSILDFPTNEAFTINGLQCRKISGEELLSTDGRVELRGENLYCLVTPRGNCDFSVPEAQDQRNLADKMKQYQYNLACVSNYQNGSDIFFLHIAFFFRAERMPAFNIAITDKVKQTLIKKGFARADSLESDVKRNFLLTNGTNSCYAVSIGNFKRDPAEEDSNSQSGGQDPADKNAASTEAHDGQDIDKAKAEGKTIVLCGKDYTFNVKLRGDGGESFFCAESMDARMRKIPPLALFIGDLSFSEHGQLIAERLKRELDLTRGYLDVWDRYTSIEGNFLLKKAREIGLISFDRKNVGYVSGGFKVYPKGMNDERRKLLSEGDELLVSEDIPIYIKNEDMGWKDFKVWAEQSSKSGIKERKRPAVLKLERIEKDGSWFLSVKAGEDFPAGAASLNLEGDLRQIARREDARERIANCESANPALGLLIEGKKSGVTLEARKQTPINPISPFVKEKLFGGREPRERQKEAISIALNTPDIALIQGPPGTGKTTVITAIVERLHELTDKRRSNQGQALLTSFQHDAVRNVVARLQINSLPTPKYGRQGLDDTSHEQAIEQWRLDYAERLKERNPEIRQSAEQQELSLRRNAYLISPGASNARRFLEYAKKLNSDNALACEIDRLLAEMDAQESQAETQLLVKLRRIRTTLQGFLDDGPAMADKALMQLEKILDANRPKHKAILDALDEAANFTGNDVDDAFLKRLAKARADLIGRCSPKPAYCDPRPNPEILAVFDSLQLRLRKPKNEVDEILSDLLNELENNTVAIDDILNSYSFAYAATAQQSEGKDIKKAKNVDKEEHPEYDTVIIDEAARVNPGDLLIPMSQARRRIILVGDHRQLPHIYDEEIFESMRADADDIDVGVATVSMFQYIKEKLKELEKIDHIPRAITLDAQYRMHPVLGNFINRNFYEPYGEGFESPLGEEHFKQGICPKPCAWIDLPNRLGGERRKGSSRQRECEADCIVDNIRTYMESAEGENLTYGVITFYRAQKDLISTKLREAGLLNKVRVGTVDAFQGMEFDVIFLSAVRTHAGPPNFDETILCGNDGDLEENKEARAARQSYRENIGNKCYGRLTSENLLCVSLSRQKRLLIVVGDAAIFHEGKWGELAEKCVPALRNFYELCANEGMVIRGNA